RGVEVGALRLIERLILGGGGIGAVGPVVDRATEVSQPELTSVLEEHRLVFLILLGMVAGGLSEDAETGSGQFAGGGHPGGGVVPGDDPTEMGEALGSGIVDIG